MNFIEHAVEGEISKWLSILSQITRALSQHGWWKHSLWVVLFGLSLSLAGFLIWQTTLKRATKLQLDSDPPASWRAAVAECSFQCMRNRLARLHSAEFGRASGVDYSRPHSQPLLALALGKVRAKRFFSQTEQEEQASADGSATDC